MSVTKDTIAADQSAITTLQTQQTTDQAALAAAEAIVATDQAAVNKDAENLLTDQSQLAADQAALAAEPAPTVLSVLVELQAAAAADSTVSASILALIAQALNLAQMPAPTSASTTAVA